MFKSPKEPPFNPLYPPNTGGILKLEDNSGIQNSAFFHRFPKLVVLALAAIILAVFCVAVFSTSPASAQQQVWYFSNIDSGEDDFNGNTVYVMYKGDNNNETANYVIIPDEDFRIWIADQAVQADEIVFDPSEQCYWDVGIGLSGQDNNVDWFVGGWDPDTNSFYDETSDGDGDNNKLTLQQGHYLSMALLDSDTNSWDVNVRVTWTRYPPYVGTYLAWTCDDPPYPVPDVGAWIMFASGGIVIGFIIWRFARKDRLRRFLLN